MDLLFIMYVSVYIGNIFHFVLLGCIDYYFWVLWFSIRVSGVCVFCKCGLGVLLVVGKFWCCLLVLLIHKFRALILMCLGC